MKREKEAEDKQQKAQEKQQSAQKTSSPKMPSGKGFSTPKINMPKIPTR